MRLLARLDHYGLGDPNNNEGHVGDRCSACEWPMLDHPSRAGVSATWPHRRHAAANLLFDRLDRFLARIGGMHS
jgi:hypothetical protein